MYWRDVVTLKAVTEGRDADGFPKEAITETTVFADVSSTKRSEFYAARQAGISLALTVKLRTADYNGQERLSYEGKEYKVERAYKGAATEYIVFNYTELPADFADDDAAHYRYLVQVHLYAPLEKNTRTYRREISRRLVAAGFTRPTVTPASDKNGQHYAFECEIAGGIDDG